MKNKMFATATAFAALVGVAQISRADEGARQFTPMEELSPDIRMQLSSTIFELTKDVEIDWDSVVVGLDEDGFIWFRAKSETGTRSSGNFSCATSFTTERPKK